MTVSVILAETMTSIVMAEAVLQHRRTVTAERGLSGAHDSADTSCPRWPGRSGGTPTDLRCEKSIHPCESR